MNFFRTNVTQKFAMGNLLIVHGVIEIQEIILFQSSQSCSFFLHYRIRFVF